MYRSTLLQPEDSSLVGRITFPEDPALWFLKSKVGGESNDPFITDTYPTSCISVLPLKSVGRLFNSESEKGGNNPISSVQLSEAF